MKETRAIEKSQLDEDLADVLEHCQHRFDNIIKDLSHIRRRFADLKVEIRNGNVELDSINESFIKDVADSFTTIQEQIETARKNIYRDLITAMKGWE